MRLSLALKKFIHELDELSIDDMALYVAFEDLYGFDVDRLETSIALSGATVAASNGASVTPSELTLAGNQPMVVSWDIGAQMLLGFAQAHNKNH